MNPIMQIQESLLSLEAELLKDTPQLPKILRTIHTKLKKDPNVVTLLSEAECATLVNGLKTFAQVELVSKAAKMKTSTPLKTTTLDDL